MPLDCKKKMEWKCVHGQVAGWSGSPVHTVMVLHIVYTQSDPQGSTRGLVSSAGPRANRNHRIRFLISPPGLGYAQWAAGSSLSCRCGWEWTQWPLSIPFCFLTLFTISENCKFMLHLPAGVILFRPLLCMFACTSVSCSLLPKRQRTNSDEWHSKSSAAGPSLPLHSHSTPLSPCRLP